MNLVFRILAALGLILTASIVVEIPLLTETIIASNQSAIAYINSNFYTNCRLYGNTLLSIGFEKCVEIKYLIAASLLASAFSIILFQRRAAFALSAISNQYYYVGVAAWGFFYANPMVDKSKKNLDWFLQAGVIVTGLLLIASSISKPDKSPTNN